jgi:hypothetical protein
MRLTPSWAASFGSEGSQNHRETFREHHFEQLLVYAHKRQVFFLRQMA